MCTEEEAKGGRRSGYGPAPSRGDCHLMAADGGHYTETGKRDRSAKEEQMLTIKYGARDSEG
jgi:hypothetical protein